jgi:hypothetical protein
VDRRAPAPAPAPSPYRSCARHGGACFPVSVMETVGPSSLASDRIHSGIGDPDLGKRARNRIVQDNGTLSCFERQAYFGSPARADRQPLKLNLATVPAGHRSAWRAVPRGGIRSQYRWKTGGAGQHAGAHSVTSCPTTATIRPSECLAQPRHLHPSKPDGAQDAPPSHRDNSRPWPSLHRRHCRLGVTQPDRQSPTLRRHAGSIHPLRRPRAPF